MPYIPEIQIGNATYKVKDAEAREMINALNHSVDGDVMTKKDMLIRIGLGHYVTAGGEEEGYRTTASPNTLGMQEIRYAERSIVVFAKNYTSITIGGYIFSKVDGKFTNGILMNWFNDRRRSFCIPAGTYYWIGFRDGNNPIQATIEDVAKQYEVFDPEENVGFCYASYQGEPVYDTTTATRIGHIVPEYASEETVLHSDDWAHQNTVLALYESDSPYTNVPTQWYERVNNDIIIPAGKYYRCTPAFYDDGGTIQYYSSYEEALDWFHKLHFIPMSEWNGKDNYQNDRVDISGLHGLIANLAKRIDVLEKANDINEIPSYYETYIADKISEINRLRPESGGQFVFITDIHVGGYSSWGGNRMHSHALINKICQETTVDKVFNGGDLLNNRADWTVQGSIEKIRTAMAYSTPDTLARCFYIVGNHDGGLDYNSSGDTISPWHITPDMLTMLSNVYANSDVCVYDEHSPFQYYYDNVKEKIRYIVMDFGLRDESTGEGYIDTWKFFATALLTTPNEYTVIVLNHKPGYNKETGVISETSKQYIYNTFDAYRNKTTYTLTGGNTVDFTNALGEAGCLIFGHTHMDAAGFSEAGIPWTITSCDNMGGENETYGVTREIGTVSEQLFDVVSVDTTNKVIHETRIGGGYNRIMHYESKHVSGTTLLTSELEGTLTWSSNNQSSVNISNGTVYAITSGTATVKATDASGNSEMWFIVVP